MMKLIVQIFLPVFISLFSFAQEVSVKWGKENQIPRKSYIKRIIGEDEKGFYLLRTIGETRRAPGEIFLERYSNDGITLLNSGRISVPKINGENVKFEQIFLLHGELLLFTSFYNKTEGSNGIYVQNVDEFGKGKTEPKLIHQIHANQKKNIGRFEIVLSQDSTKILICSNEPFERYSGEKMHYRVIDSQNLSPLWTTDIELPYNEKELRISNHIIDKAGNVHMLAKVTRKQEKDRSQANYYFTIISYIHAEDEIKEYEVSLKDKSVTDIAFKLSPSGDLVAAGFYSNSTKGVKPANSFVGFNSISLREETGMVAGTFYLKIDQQTHKITSRGIKEFDKSFLKEFMSDRSIERGRELYSYLIDHFIIREDGGAILVGEQYFNSVFCNYDPRTGIRNCNYHYYYNDIVVVNIDPDGSISWARKVPKLQHSVNDDGFYSSYIFGYDSDNLYFLFNDHPKNLVLRDESRVRYMNNAYKSVVALVTINDKGDIKKSPFFAAKDQKVIIRPKIFKQVSNNTAIIYGQKRRTFKMGRLNFLSPSGVSLN
jgi:hypothetical protein